MLQRFEKMMKDYNHLGTEAGKRHPNVHLCPWPSSKLQWNTPQISEHAKDMYTSTISHQMQHNKQSVPLLNNLYSGYLKQGGFHRLTTAFPVFHTVPCRTTASTDTDKCLVDVISAKLLPPELYLGRGKAWLSGWLWVQQLCWSVSYGNIAYFSLLCLIRVLFWSVCGNYVTFCL